MTTHLISDEEKALLDAAKKACQHIGFIKGEMVSQIDGREEAFAALHKMVICGAQVVDGMYVRDMLES